MLEKCSRIRKEEDFDRVFRQGKPLFFGEIACKFLPTRDPFFRVGFSCGKKPLPLATERNRLRRRLSHAIFQEKKHWPTGFDVVFFTTRKPKDASYATMEQVATRLFQALNNAKRDK